LPSTTIGYLGEWVAKRPLFQSLLPPLLSVLGAPQSDNFPQQTAAHHQFAFSPILREPNVASRRLANTYQSN
jgi:hypothetical protein